MSVEFDDFAKQRENGADETNSKIFNWLLDWIVNWFIGFFILDLVDFTDEEGYGKYLDLHESYIKYTNLKGFDVITFQSNW